MTYDLRRFHRAQATDYEAALAQIRSGRKTSHWIWYIFPQVKGLGHSYNAEYFGLDGMEEARAYLEDPVLKGRLVEISTALLELPDHDPVSVMGFPADLKLCSCMTLFHHAAPEEAVFQQVLDQFFHGKEDELTLRILSEKGK